MNKKFLLFLTAAVVVTTVSVYIGISSAIYKPDESVVRVGESSALVLPTPTVKPTTKPTPTVKPTVKPTSTPSPEPTDIPAAVEEPVTEVVPNNNDTVNVVPQVIQETVIVAATTPETVPTEEPVVVTETPDDSGDTNQVAYSEDDLYWLSRAVQAEAGSSWLPDWFQQAVASVIVNRSNHGSYPSGIYNVIFQAGQYSCVNSGAIYNSPSEKVTANCKTILQNGSTLPSSVVFQSEFIQGSIHDQYYDSVLGTTTYFCYF